MKLVRHPSYTTGKAVLYALKLGLALAVAFCLAGLAWHLSSANARLAVCCVGLALIVVARDYLAPKATSWGSGALGESKVRRALGALPDTYTVVTGYAPPGEQRGDIDLIVIGPMGLVPVEVKAYEGHIVCERGRCRRRQPNGWMTNLKDVGSQARGHRQSLVRLLKRPGLGLPYIPVLPVVVIVDADSLDVRDCDLPVMELRALLNYVTGLAAPLVPDDVDRLVALLSEGALPTG